MVVRVGPNEVISPCIGVCELNDEEICLGCGRTLDDIAIWSNADDGQRQQILEQAKIRRAQLNPEWEPIESS